MAATILADLDGLLKRNYGKDFITQQQTDADFITRIPLAPDKPQGEDGAYRFGVRLERRQNGGAQNQAEQFRTNRTGVRKQSIIVAKINIWAIELTGFAMNLSQTALAAFVSGIDDEFSDALAMMKKDENRQAFGSGNGILALVSGALSDDTALVVDTPGVQYFFPGERIDIFTAAGVLQASDVSITSIAESTNTLTLATAVTVSNNSEIFRTGVNTSAPSDGKEMMGMFGLTDDGTEFTTFQGLSRSTFPTFVGSITDASSAQITNDLLQRSIDKGERLSGRNIDKIVSHRNQRRAYLNVVTPAKRFNSNQMDSGYTKGSLDWNGMNWEVSHDCQREVVYAWPTEMVRRYESFALKLDDTEGHTVHRIPGTDTFEAYYKHYANVGTRHPAAIVRLDNLATLTDS